MPNAKRKTETPAPRRSRVGGMLGAYLDTKPAPTEKATRASKAESAAPRVESVPEGRRKARATWDLPAELLDECRDAVVALAGPPCRLTMSSLVEDALRHELDRLKREHHKGKPFPSRAAEKVRMGRPVR